MEVNYRHTLAFLLTSFFVSSPLQAQPPITFSITNETTLSLDTSIAGYPGKGIAASSSKTVLYYLIAAGCNANQTYENCAIDFVNNENGDKVASVYINAATATLNAEPTFYGQYASLYEVTGWEASPLNEIHIRNKANV